MRIRPENITELDEIYSLIENAFKTANVSDGDEQNFAVRQRNSQNYIPDLALVAEDNNTLIGHMMLTHMLLQTESASLSMLLLAPVSVVLDYQQQGVGSALITEGLRLAKEKGYRAVIVVGDPRYYERFGFKSISNYSITCLEDIPPQYVMLYELKEGCLADVVGAVSFNGL